MARLNKTEIDLESLFREAENPSIDNLEYPISSCRKELTGRRLQQGWAAYHYYQVGVDSKLHTCPLKRLEELRNVFAKQIKIPVLPMPG
jgi:hypothetical protein